MAVLKMECSIKEVALAGHDFRWGVASTHEGSCLPVKSSILPEGSEIKDVDLYSICEFILIRDQNTDWLTEIRKS